jgi:hypothetical protein
MPLVEPPREEPTCSECFAQGFHDCPANKVWREFFRAVLSCADRPELQGTAQRAAEIADAALKETIRRGRL